MTSKPQTSGPNLTAAPNAQQPKLKNVSTRTSSALVGVGRAGSAGGVVLETHIQGKSSKAPASRATTAQDLIQDVASTPNRPRRKPRKLNKEPTSASTQKVASATKSAKEGLDPAANAELEALKSRVRGLEAKVEQLYSGAETKGARSPRRRGKGRKAPSSTQSPVISSNSDTAAKAKEIDDEDEEVNEDLVRLEGELKVARQDLEAYRPRLLRPVSQEIDEIEEIPCEGVGLEDADKGIDNKRHVTLSGSYRIPLPTSVSMDDVRTIQSGVSAAHNVARSFFEQRRATESLREQQSHPSSLSSRPARTTTPRAVNSSMEVAVATDGEGGKQSWSEWIGGYSMAISRAVKNMEHEALVESQTAGDTIGGTLKTSAQTSRMGNVHTSKKKNAGAKRPAAKARLSSEQVQGLMS